MRDKKIRILVPFLCLFILVGSGCNKGAYVDNQNETKVVTDCLNREVKIPKNPKRVVCLYAATAHMMALVDEGDKIVGSPNGIKRDVVMRTKYPKIKDIAVPFQNGSINIEELVEVDADIALVRKSTAQNPGEVQKLKKLNIPYVAVEFSNLKELKESIKLIGDIFEKQKIANNYIKYMDDTFDYVSSHLGTIEENKKVRVFHSTNEATKTYAGDNFSQELMQIAQAKNVALDMKLSTNDDGGYTSLEEIYKVNPEVIFANDYNVVGYILDGKKWRGIDAVKNKRVIALPIGVSRWGHFGSIEPQMGALFIASTLYPEKFKDLDMTKVTIDYYSKFFKLDITPDKAEQILSGKGMRLVK